MGGASDRKTYCIVSDNVAVCCREPDVAVIVTVDVEDCWPDELHPESRLKPNTPIASTSNNCMPRRFLHPKKQRASARVVPGNSGLEL